MADYHLGHLDDDLRHAAPGAIDRGKRMRPTLALLACAAVGGEPASAAPLAAAIELLHNFTLIHDDIQDLSVSRRHRPTVWARWGSSQAINAGDALFAAAHNALYRLVDRDVSPALVLRLAAAFDAMTIEIVRGQASDLQFEGRDDVTAAAYLEMIRGKTAAIVRYATWSGALVGGAVDGTADQLGQFGEALGLGFQIRDDALGIWGLTSETGKAEADDIRRRKQSLPIVLLRQEATGRDSEVLDRIYDDDEIDAAGVQMVLSLLDRYQVRAAVEAIVKKHHDLALAGLLGATPPPLNEATVALAALTDRLSTRVG